MKCMEEVVGVGVGWEGGCENERLECRVKGCKEIG